RREVLSAAAEIRRLRLGRIEENLPRIAFVTLGPRPIFLSFATPHCARVLELSRVEMRSGLIVLHSCGERPNQRTGVRLTWGWISLLPKDLAYYGRVLARAKLMAPRSTQFLRPPLGFVGELLHLHRGACRFAKTNPDMIVHKEVTRAL